MSNDKTYVPWSYRIQYTDKEIKLFIAKFKKRFPTEASLIAEVLRICKKLTPSICEFCKSPNIENTLNPRKLKCRDCCLFTWITSGTFFHGANKLYPRVLAIHMWEAGIFISSSRFHRLVGVAQSTALLILKRISTVVKAKYAEEETQIPTSEFNEIYCKRSNETPANQHPRAEQTRLDARLAREERRRRQEQLDENTDEALNEAMKKALSEGSDFDEDSVRIMSSTEKAVYELIGFEPIHFDDILNALPIPLPEIAAAVSKLELSEFTRRTNGDFHVRIDEEELKKIREKRKALDSKKPSFDAITYFIGAIHHGISRKHIENYVAEFWCFFDKQTWANGALFEACALHAGITEKQITEDVSPAFISFPELCINVPDFF
jgi:hypothetical protein